MKAAVLADIHGNIAALKEVLKEVRAQKIETLFLLGDFVGYYYHPEKALSEFETFKYFAVRGNHEEMLIEAENDPALLNTLTNQFGHGLSLALEKLSPLQRKWLRDLPPTLTVELKGVRLLLCHGSPWDTSFYVYPDADEEVKTRCFKGGHDFTLLGHTHRSMVFNSGSQILLNPGSVGQNREKGGIAEWAIIDIATRKFEFCRTPYDTTEVLEEAQKLDSDLPFLQEVLKR